MGFFSYARTHTHQLVVITAPCELDAHDWDAMHNEQLFVCLFFGIDLYAHTDNWLRVTNEATTEKNEASTRHVPRRHKNR